MSGARRLSRCANWWPGLGCTPAEALAVPELEADDLVVHGAGEVASPGLHELPAGAEAGVVGTWFLSR